MSKDTVKINLKAEIKNMGEIEKQIEILQNQLNNMKVNLIVEDDKVNEDNELTLQEVIESKVDQAIKDVKNSPMYIDDGEECKNTTYILKELVIMLLRVSNGQIDIRTTIKINNVIDYKANIINNCRMNDNIMYALNNLAHVKNYIDNCKSI